MGVDSNPRNGVDCCENAETYFRACEGSAEAKAAVAHGAWPNSPGQRMTAATLRRSATRVTCTCDSLSFGGGHQGYRSCGRGARLATDIDGMAAMGARAATLGIGDSAADVTGAALVVTTVRSLDDRQGSLRMK